MHEFWVTENILDIALKEAEKAQARKVTKINLVVGELTGFVPDCIQFYFDTMSKKTIAEKASLQFELAPAQLRCRDCSTVFEPKEGGWQCPQCHSQSVEITGGRNLYISSMEVD
jgi:hydrogenase nickel incorporation protein HypA/HybF